MNVLLVGDNAVAHAVADKVARSAKLYSVLRRENPGIKRISEAVLMQSTPSPRKIVEFAEDNGVEVAVVLSRTFINRGTVDGLKKRGIPTIGPSKEMAKIESDKEFARELMKKLSLPMIEGEVLESETEAGELAQSYGSYVVKPTYYTMGRGTRPSSAEFGEKEVREYAKEILAKGGKVLVERKVSGTPFVVMGFTDGDKTYIAPPVMVLKMYKGKASQGYGSLATGELLPFLTKEDLEESREMLQKLAQHLSREGGFRGAFGLELIKSNEGLRTTGFSSTFSDPATLNIMPLMKTPFAEMLKQMWEGNLGEVAFKVKPNVVKYFFAPGYPRKAKEVEVRIDENCLWKKGLKYYFQGVVERDGKLYSTESRSLAVFSSGGSLEEAEKIANSGSECLPGLEFVERLLAT